MERSTCCWARESQKFQKSWRNCGGKNSPGLVAVEYEKEGPVEDDMRQEVEYARKLAGLGA